MSGNFIKVAGCIDTPNRSVSLRPIRRIPGHHAHSYIRVSEIKELCAIEEGPHRLTVEISKAEYDELEKTAPEDVYRYTESNPDRTVYIKYVPTTEIVLGFVSAPEREGVPYSDMTEVLVSVLVAESTESLLARINAIEFPPEPEPVPDPNAVPILNDRDIWLPGETYNTFDVVKDPGNVTERYMCLRDGSTSLVVATLTGRSTWFPLP